MIAVFESFDRSEICLNPPAGGEAERNEGETGDDRVSLAREESPSKDVWSLGDFNEVVSAVPWGLELSDDEVDGRDSSGGFSEVPTSIGRDNNSSPFSAVCWETEEGDVLEKRVGTGLVLGVRNWVLETACLSTVGTLKGGLAARGDELNERGLMGLG
jgi:hypothetical protein